MRAQFQEAGFDDVELIPSGGGVFEITIDGALRFSKKSVGRFPNESELNALKAKTPG